MAGVGVGINPLRGQNNVEGAVDMGCDPGFLPGYQPVEDPVARAKFELAWGPVLLAHRGLTIPEMREAAHRGKVRAMCVFGEDVVQTDPDSERTIEALERLEFLVVQELFLSESGKLAHVVLPGARMGRSPTASGGSRECAPRSLHWLGRAAISKSSKS